MKVLIVDDHPLVREGLAAILSNEAYIASIEQAAACNEAVEKIQQLDPDIVLLDLRLDRECGLDLIPKIRGNKNKCKYVVLTSSSDRNDFKRAENLGVDGYILKDAYPEEILLGLKLISRGRKYYDPGILEIILKKEDMDPIEELTIREQEVLRELGKGMTNKQIAQNLFITEYTVKKHVSQILAKLGLADRTQAALYANSHQVV
ncbi:MAG: response regulator transcription factor [Caldicoprobacterales bacterium]|jgi:two-component system nitrate/nitrite response regulator NarL|nr:response regulator transcription factor [Clostridiales bacterium]